ncbi:3-keto-5-aminohexanoate cleavage protein [Nocardioides sp. BYT-33-1]|uniref:3-keto-5-aminohexanoate cleavage protein n=1 Tax=Nocardioides sp. BYT-33-1 TaxID=3416952 RepID=UPI003F5325E4
MSEVFITVAPTGAESGYDDNPGIPLQPDEIVAQAVASERAGASLVHIHGRDRSGASSLDRGILTEIMHGVREHTDLVVQLSTGGGVRDSFEDRMAVVGLQPESCSLTCGSVNFGDEIFRNPYPFVERLYLAMLENDVLPEFECFDLGHVATLHRLLDRHGPPRQGVVHCNLVMGVPGGMPGTPEALLAARAQLPAGASWSATGIGRSTLPVMLTTLALGGHLRVGMEDVLRFSRDEPVRDNAQLVDRAVALARIAQRPVLDSTATRALLGLSR